MACTNEIKSFPPGGLFIVGHARSGTTVLQYALNSSPEIHLFGEANFHNHAPNGPGFAEWYNAMHVSFGNPPAKGDRCPDIPGSLMDVLCELRQQYTWIGDKLAFRDESLGYSFDNSYNFHHRWFPKAVYICTLRDPASTIQSNIDLFKLDTFEIYIASYIRCILHLVNVYLSFDRTLIAHYENMSKASFDRIAGHLDVPLNDAFTEYDTTRQIRRSGEMANIQSDDLALAWKAYEGVCELLDPATMRFTNRGQLRKFQRELYQQVARIQAGQSETTSFRAVAL